MHKVEELTRKVSELSLLSERTGRQYEAHLALYNVACEVDDKKQCDELREKMHNFLDMILDAGYQIQQHRIELLKIAMNP